MFLAIVAKPGGHTETREFGKRHRECSRVARAGCEAAAFLARGRSRELVVQAPGRVCERDVAIHTGHGFDGRLCEIMVGFRASAPGARRGLGAWGSRKFESNCGNDMLRVQKSMLELKPRHCQAPAPPRELRPTVRLVQLFSCDEWAPHGV